MAESIGDMNNMSRQSAIMSLVLFRLGNIAEAETYAQKILEADKLYGGTLRHYQLGSIAMAQHRWEESLTHYRNCLEAGQNIDQIPIPQWHILLGNVHLKKGDCCQAVQSFQEAVNAAIQGQERQISSIPGILARMEEAYVASGAPEKFMEYCHSLKEQHADVLRERRFPTGYLEPAEPSVEFSHLSFADDFGSEVADSSWNWVDEFRDCSCQITGGDGSVICAANGRDLFRVNLSAPRLMQEIAYDFAAEVRILPASDDKPQMGGLLVWKDRDNFLRFEKGVDSQKEIHLRGHVDGKWQVAGSGLMPGDGETHLRLERSGHEFSAYCSADGENWLTCGTITLPMDDPIQVGIHAIGMIDRTIYCSAYKEGTATMFRNFRIWTR